ncbi:elongin-C [Trichonephila clavipes]|nr:elongin-C [Trichonephila clavipes]
MADAQPVYGGHIGPGSMYVKIIAKDGHEFFIKREYIITANAVPHMLAVPDLENSPDDENILHLKDISSLVIQKMCQYFAYKAQYFGGPPEIPNFDVDLEIALELLMAANFLDC